MQNDTPTSPNAGIALLLNHFDNEDVCRKLLIQKRWNGQPICPYCNNKKAYPEKDRFRCASKQCRKYFSITFGTMFDSGKIKLKYWFASMFLYDATEKQISANELSQYIGVPQKIAAHILGSLSKEMV